MLKAKAVKLKEGWPRGELPSKVGCASTCRLALRCGIRWAWPTMAMPLRPVSTCTTRATRRRDIGQVVHTLNRMFNLNVPPPWLRAGLLGPRVVSPHPQGLQGSHLNLS